MIPMSAAMLAIVAALSSVVAAVWAHLMRARTGRGAGSRDLGELEQAVEHLVRRLEMTAGRCIHDLQSREHELRRLPSGEETVELAPGAGSPALSAAEGPDPAMRGFSEAAPGRAPTSPAMDSDSDEAKPAFYFGSDLVSRAAQACELAERETDEATICRVTGLQRAELRLLLSLRQAQQKAA